MDKLWICLVVSGRSNPFAFNVDDDCIYVLWKYCIVKNTLVTLYKNDQYTYQRSRKKQLRINGVRSVGLMLVGLNLIFGIFVSLVTHGEGSFRYSQGVFYLMILYVGFGFWASLTNAIRDRGIGMMWNSLRMINLSAAITGVFILIAGFYDNYILEMSTRNLVLSITGTFSFMILLLLTVHTLLLSDGEEK